MAGYAEDWVGLRQVWPPHGASTQTSFDLVVVHGLSGGSLSTWTHSEGQCWLQWLSRDIPELRIFSFGYAAQEVYLSPTVKAGVETGRIFTFAEALAGALKDSRIERQYPLAFLGHGVGGIIVKSLLTYCNARRLHFGEILEATHHVVFLDTPHRGFDMGVWEAINGGVTTTHAQEQFGLWSTVLSDLSRAFVEIANRLPISSVHSTVPTETKDGKLRAIEYGSATLDAVYETHVYLTGTSHAKMCIFTSPLDSNYLQLKDRIQAETITFARKRDIEASVLSGSFTRRDSPRKLQEMKQQLTEGSAINEKLGADQNVVVQDATKIEHEKELELERKLKKKIKKWLFAAKVDLDVEDDLENYTGLEGTCTWLLDHAKYKTWKSKTSSQLVWLHGIQGCGKSTLIARVIRQLEVEQVNMVYLFCRSDESVSTPARVACLVGQMISHSDAVFQNLKSAYEKTNSTSVTTMSTARTIFKAALKAFAPCYVMIDALDECADRAALIALLLEVSRELPIGIKMLCSSRNELDIDRLLRGKPCVEDISVDPDTIKGDISRMIDYEFDSCPDLVERTRSDPGAKADILTALRERAQGMFLLPKLMIADLSMKASLNEIYDHLVDIPVGLHPYYLRTLQRMQPGWRPLAKKAFTWIVWARRPLSLRELEEVFSISGDQYLNLVTDLKRACGSLITVTESEVRLSHSSVRRFLVDSRKFHQSPLHREIVSTDPDGQLADICTTYLFQGDYRRPPRAAVRFSTSSTASWIECCPFLKYASLHWIVHCQQSKDPLRYVPAIRNFIMSPRLFEWHEAVSRFIVHDTFDQACSMLQAFVIELTKRLDFEMYYGAPKIFELSGGYLEQISHRLRQLRAFEELWELAVATWPEELDTVAPLIDGSGRTINPERQDTMLIQSPSSRRSRELYDMLEKRCVTPFFDRFMLADLNIFMWQSLMPSAPWAAAFGFALSPDEPQVIRLRTESISSHWASERHGIDPAAVGSMLTSAILRDDLRAVAIVWARFSADPTLPLDVKTYAWILQEVGSRVVLQRIEWTDVDDPCRVDLTSSHTFKNSKGAVAFSNDRKYIWTAGGRYDLQSGHRTPAPGLFRDPDMSAITFSRNASSVAGIRRGGCLEVYNIPRFDVVARHKGDCKIQGVSPFGKFVLFLENREAGGGSGKPMDVATARTQQLCLLNRQGQSSLLWDFSNADNLSKGKYSVENLDYFYNNGGLHAFSENESIICLCIPTAPDWSLLAFDLEKPDVASTVWKIEYSSLLMGADILSIAFCPLNERRLYVLDGFSIMRYLDISRQSSTSAASVMTLRAEGAFPVLSAVVCHTTDRQLITATFDDDPIEGLQSRQHCLEGFGPIKQKFRAPSFLRDLRLIESSNLIVDFSPILESMAYSTTNAPDPTTWSRVGTAAQAAIEATLGGLREAHEDEDFGSNELHRDLTPRTTTSITFNSSATIGFFQSVVYFPLPTLRGQPLWEVTMIMDIRYLDVPKARKTGDWCMAVVGTAKTEHLASAYHAETKLLAYSVTLDYFDKSEETHNWFLTRLSLCHLGQNPHWDLDFDPRGTYLISNTFSISYSMITTWEFSNCGRFLYGTSLQHPSRIIEFDTEKSRITRTVMDPFHVGVLSNMTLSFHDNTLHAISTYGSTVMVAKLPFRDSTAYAARCVAIGPSTTQYYEKLRMLFPRNAGDQFVIVGQATNYLRKDGHSGGSLQWPVVLRVTERNMGEWTDYKEIEDPTMKTSELANEGDTEDESVKGYDKQEDLKEEDGKEEDGKEEDGKEEDGKEEDGKEEDGKEEDGREEDGKEVDK